MVVWDTSKTLLLVRNLSVVGKMPADRQLRVSGSNAQQTESSQQELSAATTLVERDVSVALAVSDESGQTELSADIKLAHTGQGCFSTDSAAARYWASPQGLPSGLSKQP